MELNGIGFNRLNIFLSCVKTYPSKENQAKRKILKKQIRSNKNCPLFKSYRKFVKIIKTRQKKEES